MTRTATIAAVCAAALAAISAGCGGSTGPAGTTGPPSAGADGRAAFNRSCADCHGVDLRGTDRGPSLLSIVYEPGHHSDMAFRIAVRNGSPQHHWGFGDMPAVDGVSDAELEAVIAYVRAAQQREGFEPAK